VEQGVLVERRAVARVLPAEDVATAPAVVAAHEEAKAVAAIASVAAGCGSVGLVVRKVSELLFSIRQDRSRIKLNKEVFKAKQKN
jgi:hypothetical protein